MKTLKLNTATLMKLSSIEKKMIAGGMSMKRQNGRSESGTSVNTKFTKIKSCC